MPDNTTPDQNPVSEDDAFGPSLPTEDQAFGGLDQSPSTGPISGSFADSLFSSPHIKNIVSAFGQGASEGWGSIPLGLTPQLQKSINQYVPGLLNDYKDGHNSLLKSFNEAIIRPIIGVGTLVFKAGAAALGAVGGAGTQFGTELVNTAKEAQQEGPLGEAAAPFLGEAGEYSQALFSGQYLPDHTPEPPEPGVQVNPQTLMKARSEGTLGEGEQGYFNTKAPDPEALEGRTVAAQEASIPPPKPEPPVTDIHTIARQISPDTFYDYDIATNKHQLLQQAISDLRDQRDSDPKIQAAQSQVDTILSKVNNVEDRLTKSQQENLDNLRGYIDDFKKVDSPEMVIAKEALARNHQDLMDLAPDLRAVYQHARTLLPEDTEIPGAEVPKESTEEGGEASKPEQPEEVASNQPTEAFTAPEDTGKVYLPPGAKEAVAEAPRGTTEGSESDGMGEGGAGLRPVKGTGETKTRGLSKTVESKFIEDKLTSSFGDLPEYDVAQVKDQAKKAAEFINNNSEAAIRVAKGEEQPPEGILASSVHIGVRQLARKTGDVELGRQLAHSRFATDITTMAQNIRMLRDQDPTDPVSLIQKIEKSNSDALARTAKGKDTIKKTVEQNKEAIKQAKSGAWDPIKFIKSIECGY